MFRLSFVVVQSYVSLFSASFRALSLPCLVFCITVRNSFGYLLYSIILFSPMSGCAHLFNVNSQQKTDFIKLNLIC